MTTKELENKSPAVAEVSTSNVVPAVSSNVKQRTSVYAPASNASTGVSSTDVSTASNASSNASADVSTASNASPQQRISEYQPRVSTYIPASEYQPRISEYQPRTSVYTPAEYQPRTSVYTPAEYAPAPTYMPQHAYAPAPAPQHAYAPAPAPAPQKEPEFKLTTREMYDSGRTSDVFRSYLVSIAWIIVRLESFLIPPLAILRAQLETFLDLRGAIVIILLHAVLLIAAIYVINVISSTYNLAYYIMMRAREDDRRLKSEAFISRFNDKKKKIFYDAWETAKNDDNILLFLAYYATYPLELISEHVVYPVRYLACMLIQTTLVQVGFGYWLVGASTSPLSLTYGYTYPKEIK